MPVKYRVPQGSLVFFVCLMGVLNKDMKDDDRLHFISLEILCLLIFVTLVKIKSNFMSNLCRKPENLTVHLLFLATVYLINCTLSLFCSVEHIIFLLS